MIEALSYSFVQNAVISGVLISIVCGIVGTLVIVNRMVFIAGGIAHGAYGGLGIAFFLGISPLFGILSFSLFLAFIIAFLTYQNTQRIDAIIGAIWAFGMAFGIVLIDLTPGYNVDLMSFLFGSILAVSIFDIYIIGAVCFGIFILTVIFYKEFLAMSFDMEFAKLQGLNVRLFHLVLIVMITLCIVVTIRAVGLILIISLLTIPPYIAEKYCSKLVNMMIFSTLLSTSFTLIGLYLSYTLNLTSGASIILVASTVFFITEGIRLLRKR